MSKATAVFALLCVSVFWTPLAHGDTIALYADSMRTDCSVSAGAGDFAVFYVYHYSSSGASGSQFRLPKPPCEFFDIFGPTIDQAAFPYTGHPESGLVFQYGECLTGWTYLAVVFYFDFIGLGQFPTCCEKPPLAHPSATSGQVEAFDCAGTPHPAAGISGIFNGDATCPCDVVTGVFDDPSAPTTWGAVKAQYKNE